MAEMGPMLPRRAFHHVLRSHLGTHDEALVGRSFT